MPESALRTNNAFGAVMPIVRVAVLTATESDGEPDGSGRLTEIALLSLIHISEPTRLSLVSRMPSSA